MIAIVRIAPSGDVFRTSVSAGGQAWSKDYSRMEDASGEAEDIGMISPETKNLLDRSQPMPSYPHGLEAKVGVDVDDLVKRGFHREPHVPGN